jgi:predicted neuraminidase
LAATALPNNNSGIDVVRLDDGNLVLAHNPVGDNSGQRTPLRLSLSRDNGRTWPHSLDLETDEGEYSCPAVIATPRGIALTYTWKRKRIAYWHGSIEQLMDKQATKRYEEMLHSGVMP